MNHIQQLSCFIGKAMYVSEFVCDKDYDALHIIVCIFKYLNAQYSSRLCFNFEFAILQQNREKKYI